MAAVAKVTFKAGPGYDDPWIVLEGTIEEVGEAMARLADEGGFATAMTVAREFYAAKAQPSGVAAVQAVFPKAEVLSDSAAPAAAVSQPAYTPTPVVQQSTPPCEHCGKPTTFHEGVGANGPWSAYFCSSADKSHSKFLKK